MSVKVPKLKLGGGDMPVITKRTARLIQKAKEKKIATFVAGALGRFQQETHEFSLYPFSKVIHFHKGGYELHVDSKVLIDRL